MKFAACSLVYNEEQLVRGCIESLRPFVDQHVMVVGEKPFFGKAQEPDRSAEIAEELGADVIKGTWELDHHQRNAGLSILQDYDWIITTDVDMWMTHDSVERIIDRLEKETNDAAIISQYSYWRDIDHILEDDDFKPVIAVRPNTFFTYIGNVGCPVGVIDDIKIHHLAWCAPKDIYKKVTTYPHAPEFDGEKWYKDHYLGYEGGSAKLPNRPYNVASHPLPLELRRYIG